MFVNVMGGQDPLMSVSISNRCDNIVGDGGNPLSGELFNKDIFCRARWAMNFNSVCDMDQKNQKMSLQLDEKDCGNSRHSPGAYKV